MISPVSPKIVHCNNINNLPNTNHSRVSFAQKIDNDIYESVYKTYSEDIKMDSSSPNSLNLYGVLDDKEYDINFERKNTSDRKKIAINGFYNGKKVEINANYKDNKHHEFKGTFGDKTFEINHRVRGLFVKDSLKGKINGQEFTAKFPSASATDENRDLMILLLHLSGYVADIKGYNFDDIDSSMTSYKYFNGTLEDEKNKCYIFDDIWRDPIPVGANSFNQV